jgi:hypothetical protein
MIPIYEEGTGKGIGHNLESFQSRFDQICAEHLAKGRARSFAFIFYNFLDNELRQILTNLGAFAKLDRLSGSELSVFYLHTGRQSAVDSFNSQFLSVLGVQDEASLPCIVFFRMEENKIIDIEIAELESADLIHGLDELHVAIESYLKSQSAVPTSESRAVRWIKVGAKFVSIETFRAALKHALDLIL